MKPIPRIAPADIIARVILKPSGAHELDVAVPSEIVGMKFSAGQVQQLKAAIAEYERQTLRADGGPEFYNTRMVPIEVGR